MSNEPMPPEAGRRDSGFAPNATAADVTARTAIVRAAKERIGGGPLRLKDLDRILPPLECRRTRDGQRVYVERPERAAKEANSAERRT